MNNYIEYSIQFSIRCRNCRGYGYPMRFHLPMLPIMQDDLDKGAVEELFNNGYLRASDNSFVCCESCLRDYENKLQRELSSL